MPVSKLRPPHLPPGHTFFALFALLLVGLLASGCIGDADTPQNTLAPEGEVARQQRDLFMLAMWPALAVMIFVEVAIVVMLLRFRRRKDDQIPKQTHGNTPLEIAWTIVPIVIIIAFVGVPMIPVIFELGRDPADDAYPVKVTGIQWVWQFEYPEIVNDEGAALVTLGEPLHIPAGREIALTIVSADVNHSFGVPRVAGTRDAIPGQEERMWIKVDEPGSFAGQCRELCGTGHADMKVTVIAQSDEDFQAWSEEMASGVRAPVDADDPAAVSVSGSGE